MFLQVHFLNLHTFNQKLDIVKIQCWPSIPLSIWTQFLQFSRLKYPVWQTWSLLYFKLGFYRLQQAEKCSSNWEKNPFHQTGYFKLENCKNQSQIDRRNDVLVDPYPFFFWSMHTLFNAVKRYGLNKTEKGMDQPRRHRRSILYFVK